MATKTAGAQAPPPPAAPRKAAFSKETVPFQWKIAGKSGGLTVILSKHTEKDSADKELVRLAETAMYENLEILPIDAVVTQAKNALKKAKAEAAARIGGGTHTPKSKGAGGSKAHPKPKAREKAKLVSKAKPKVKAERPTKTPRPKSKVKKK